MYIAAGVTVQWSRNVNSFCDRCTISDVKTRCVLQGIGIEWVALSGCHLSPLDGKQQLSLQRTTLYIVPIKGHTKFVSRPWMNILGEYVSAATGLCVSVTLSDTRDSPYGTVSGDFDRDITQSACETIMLLIFYLPA